MFFFFSLLLSLLSEIRQDTSDVTFKAGKEVFAVKNYINRDHGGPCSLSDGLDKKFRVVRLANQNHISQKFFFLELEKLVKTEVKVPTTEFGRFNVSQEVEITVNLKEIKVPFLLCRRLT